MIKTIRVDQLQMGMYVHDLNCDWLEHGFLRPRFLLKTETDLERIRRLAIRELVIDPDKGSDVSQTPPLTESETASAPPPSGKRQPTTLTDERVQAKRIHQEAIGVVSGLMADVRLGQQIDLERANPVIGEMVDSIFRNQDALLGLTRIRNMDRYTFEHSVNVTVLMVSFAHSLELERALIHDIGIGALLHDLGKILVPSEILNKPGRLTEEEFAIMRGHVVHSRDILAVAPGIPTAALAVAAEHHERLDGSGYPDGKAGAQLSRLGQMAAIVDVYDAITSDRVYHKGMEPPLALRKLLEWSPHLFDPRLVQQFIRCVGIYPVGTLVRLRSGRLGIVIESSREGLFQPVVRVFMDAKHRRYLAVQDVDLSRQRKGLEERIERVESPEQWRINPEELLRMHC
ncbi:HD-GYP domain-containing protein [Thiocystis violacea]|uniref:HD-GYP domain-containing protein n=1 Tax=Thiocystis violacea TaxID=13725 RepID=UPI0019036FDC|nr:HD-GYP domain-containing protein [Thiocystis violacea]MBK1716101.1 phosphodiesterase [Thiocystis violacea]